MSIIKLPRSLDFISVLRRKKNDFYVRVYDNHAYYNIMTKR